PAAVDERIEPARAVVDEAGVAVVEHPAQFAHGAQARGSRAAVAVEDAPLDVLPGAFAKCQLYPRPRSEAGIVAADTAAVGAPGDVVEGQGDGEAAGNRLRRIEHRGVV